MTYKLASVQIQFYSIYEYIYIYISIYIYIYVSVMDGSVVVCWRYNSVGAKKLVHFVRVNDISLQTTTPKQLIVSFGAWCFQPTCLFVSSLRANVMDKYIAEQFVLFT